MFDPDDSYNPVSKELSGRRVKTRTSVGLECPFGVTIVMAEDQLVASFQVGGGVVRTPFIGGRRGWCEWPADKWWTKII